MHRLGGERLSAPSGHATSGRFRSDAAQRMPVKTEAAEREAVAVEAADQSDEPSRLARLAHPFVSVVSLSLAARWMFALGEPIAKCPALL